MDCLGSGKADVGGADDAGVLLRSVMPVELGTTEDKAVFTGVGLYSYAAIAGHFADLSLGADTAVVAGCGLFPGLTNNFLAENNALFVDLDGLGLGALTVEFKQTHGICNLDASLTGDNNSLQVLGAEYGAEAAAAKDLVGCNRDNGRGNQIFAKSGKTSLATDTGANNRFIASR